MPANKVKQVYVCTRGCYSDYRIVAVFSTRAKAKEFVAHQYGPEGCVKGSWDEISIERYDLDAPFAHLGGYVIWSMNSGGPAWSPEANPNAPPDVIWDHLGFPEVCGYGKTPEHARRSMDEVLRAIKAGTVVDPEFKLHERRRKREAWRVQERLDRELNADVALIEACLNRHPSEVPNAPRP